MRSLPQRNQQNIHIHRAEEYSKAQIYILDMKDIRENYGAAKNVARSKN